MIITLPDDPALIEMGEAEIRIDLACGAYAAGHVEVDGACIVGAAPRSDFLSRVHPGPVVLPL